MPPLDPRPPPIDVEDPYVDPVGDRRPPPRVLDDPPSPPPRDDDPPYKELPALDPPYSELPPVEPPPYIELPYMLPPAPPGEDFFPRKLGGHQLFFFAPYPPYDDEPYDDEAPPMMPLYFAVRIPRWELLIVSRKPTPISARTGLR